jgi:hypothetical protein
MADQLQNSGVILVTAAEQSQLLDHFEFLYTQKQKISFFLLT